MDILKARERTEVVFIVACNYFILYPHGGRHKKPCGGEKSRSSSLCRVIMSFLSVCHRVLGLFLERRPAHVAGFSLFVAGFRLSSAV